MSATTLRSDIRQEVRDNIQEASGIAGAIFSDALINRHITREIRSLPQKEVYLEELWQVTLDSTTDYSDGITVPTGTVKIEEIERNDGSSSFPEWRPLSGVDNYGGAIFLPFRVTSSMSVRAKLKKEFTVPTDDIVALDVPDDKCEIVVWGVTVRLYRILMGYLRGSQSWDSVTKPGQLEMTVVQNWLRDAERHYQELIRQYSTSPKPRDIDLTS